MNLPSLGSVGCLIAQKCKLVNPLSFRVTPYLITRSDSKQLNIKCTVYEREKYLNQRLRDWNFGIYHAQAPLGECLPDHLNQKLNTAFVNPNRGLSEEDKLTMLNAQTGELLMRMPTPNVIRLARSKFRALVAEGLDIQVSTLLTLHDLVLYHLKKEKKIPS